MPIRQTPGPWTFGRRPAHLLALEGAEAGKHKIYNLGNGSGYPVREVIEAARRLAGRRIEIIESPRRAGDPAVVVASSGLIHTESGWKPEKPELVTMLTDAWKGRRAMDGSDE